MHWIQHTSFSIKVVCVYVCTCVYAHVVVCVWCNHMYVCVVCVYVYVLLCMCDVYV